MINKRIQELIAVVTKGNKRAFSAMVGVSPTVIENIVGSRQGKPGFDLLEKIAYSIENINLDWLITGRGEMLKEEQKKEEVSINTVDASCIYNMYKDYKNMQEKKDLEIKGLQTKIDELHAKIEKQNDTINILIAENKELEARLGVLDPLQLPPVGDVLQKKSLSSQIQPIASAPVRTGKRKSCKI